MREDAPVAARVALHVAATAAATTWAHGVLQASLDDAAIGVASRAAMRLMPADPAATPGIAADKAEPLV